MNDDHGKKKTEKEHTSLPNTRVDSQLENRAQMTNIQKKY